MTMELYNNNDLKLVDKNIDSIIETIENVRKKLYPRPQDNEPETVTETYTSTETSKTEQSPTPEDIAKIVKITLDFVSNKKRKVYGGYAQNKVISFKNKADAFYKDDEIPDIDVYSPSPIDDLVELCDLLRSQGYDDVVGKEAMHKETYKIFTKGYNAIDLSYVPKNIYDNIPYVEIDNIRYTHPLFSMIDLYRMMSEPLFSSWRWKKIFVRLQLLQKHYPFQKINANPVSKPHKKNMDKVFEIIKEYVKSNTDVYIFGDFAYNEFVKEAKMKDVAYANIKSYQIVSTDYKKTAETLIKKLKETNTNISYEEYYPFWTFTGHSVEISCGGELIAKVYGSIKRCCPIKTTIDNIQIGSFDYVLLMEMVTGFREKVLRNKNGKIYHDTIISNLIKMRKYYFDKNEKTLLDNTLFQSFISSCVGEAIDPIMEAQRLRKERKEKKGSALFIYKPVRELKNKWVFANTSGNKINNPKNLKLKI